MYEAYPFTGLDATVFTVTIDGAVVLSVTDTDAARPMYSVAGPSVYGAHNLRFAVANITASAVVSALQVGSSNLFFGFDMAYAQFPFMRSAYGRLLHCLEFRIFDSFVFVAAQRASLR